jgi:hypothetical protein
MYDDLLLPGVLPYRGEPLDSGHLYLRYPPDRGAYVILMSECFLWASEIHEIHEHWLLEYIIGKFPISHLPETMSRVDLYPEFDELRRKGEHPYFRRGEEIHTLSLEVMDSKLTADEILLFRAILSLRAL